MLLLISPSLPGPEAVRQRFKGVAAEAECQGRPVKEDGMAHGKVFLGWLWDCVIGSSYQFRFYWTCSLKAYGQPVAGRAGMAACCILESADFRRPWEVVLPLRMSLAGTCLSF